MRPSFASKSHQRKVDEPAEDDAEEPPVTPVLDQFSEGGPLIPRHQGAEGRPKLAAVERFWTLQYDFRSEILRFSGL